MVMALKKTACVKHNRAICTEKISMCETQTGLSNGPKCIQILNSNTTYIYRLIFLFKQPKWQLSCCLMEEATSTTEQKKRKKQTKTLVFLWTEFIPSTMSMM